MSYTVEAGYQATNLELARIGLDNALARATTLESRWAGDNSLNDNASFPVINVTRRNTFETYRPTTWSPKIEATWSTPVVVDYLAFARHNLKSSGITGGDLHVRPPGGSLTKVLGITFTDDDPICVPFAATEIEYAEIRFGTGGDVIIAVCHLGKAVVMERPLRAAMQPVWLSRQTSVETQTTEGGELLGPILVRRGASVSPNWSNLSLGFYNDQLQPLAEQLPACPFFLAWQPDEHPAEVVYGTLSGDPSGEHIPRSDRYTFGFSMTGAAL